ncbi:aminotransferase class V-fold PLP-dependent enzyme [Lagierella sp.]|uniref:aminotransferase class V-fold PLP-dependent enzyme n=1 Tax=Lagierella sp. TaxID=2849657 RepID=UPI00262BE1D7|nr:aminotransferase class V-fold PLP-dependent enzyme [Lagierella sp.]
MIYFDNGATTWPKPEIVYEKTMEAMRKFGANPGRSGHSMSLKMDREIFNSRAKIAEFVGGDNPLNLIFTKNCTDALNIAIKGAFKEKSHVITSSMEHNSVLRPLFHLEEEGKIELTVVDADNRGVLNPEDFKEAIRDNTDMCVITGMSNLVGTITPLDEIIKILKERDIFVIVDAAQCLGYLDIDVKRQNIDILCFPGHKSLFGPMGTGGLYINTERTLRTVEEGGTGSFSQVLKMPEIYPDRLEGGTLNGPSIVGLGAGIDYINEIGLEKIREHENDLRDYFINKAKEIDNIIMYGPLDHNQGPVISMNMEGLDSSALAYTLDQDYGIATRAGFHCAPLAHKSIGTEKKGAVRFSFSYLNNKEEIDESIEALKKISQGVKSGNI